MNFVKFLRGPSPSEHLWTTASGKRRPKKKKTVEGKLLMIASIHFIALKTFSLFVKHEVQNLKAR